MINLIYDKLFELGDKLQAEGRTSDRKIVHTCEDLIHEAWVESQSARITVNKEPDNKIEEFVLSIPDLIVYFDQLDKTYYYELDDLHFDNPDEVINYLITSRDTYRRNVQMSARKEILKYIVKTIDDINFKSLTLKKPNGVVNVRISKEVK